MNQVKMRVFQKMKSICYIMCVLFSIFYVVSNTIPAEDQEKMWTNLLATKKGAPAGGAEQLRAFQVQSIPECLCSRKWMYPPTLDSDRSGQSIKTSKSYLERLNSSCSDEGTRYQTGQNVFTFSMFFPQGNINKTALSFYQNAVSQNLLKMREHYPPGYSLRVYTSVPLRPHEYFCDLLCHNDDIFWCDISKTPGYGNLTRMNFRTWRLLTLGDPTVNIFHSRDLDSLISHREAATVQDWLSQNNSGKRYKPIMVMRDRRNGQNVPILAGMWGADNRKLLGEAEKLQKRLIFMSQLSSSQEKTFDQHFLNISLFFPLAKDILAYDSYTCVKWSNFTEVRPFPVKRGNPQTDFVGNRVEFSGRGDGKKRRYRKLKCPLECRPSYGLDWNYC